MGVLRTLLGKGGSHADGFPTCRHVCSRSRAACPRAAQCTVLGTRGAGLGCQPGPPRPGPCGGGSRGCDPRQGPGARPGPLPASGAARGTRPPGKRLRVPAHPRPCSQPPAASHGENNPESPPVPPPVYSWFLALESFFLEGSWGCPSRSARGLRQSCCVSQ